MNFIRPKTINLKKVFSKSIMIKTNIIKGIVKRKVLSEDTCMN